MNAPFQTPESRPTTTRAGEGYDRKAWTVEELKAAVRAGVLEEGAPFELIEGEMLAMNAKLNRHELWKRRLVRWLIRSLPDSVAVAVEPSLFLDASSAPEPDILIHDDALMPEDVRGPDVLLLIEVCETSSQRDLVLKAALYARHGVRHYWVVDAERRRFVTHARPGPEGYGLVEAHGAAARLPLPFRLDLVLVPPIWTSSSRAGVRSRRSWRGSGRLPS